jgi:hypothetical protein
MAHQHIGTAEAPARDGRHDRYNVYAVHSDQTLTVEYAGYREGSVYTGLPLGGPGWSPPVSFRTGLDGFESVRFTGHRFGDPVGSGHQTGTASGHTSQGSAVEGHAVRDCTGRRGILRGAHSSYTARVEWTDGCAYTVDSVCLWWEWKDDNGLCACPLSARWKHVAGERATCRYAREVG